MEWGLIETPIFLTNTLSVGAVSDAAVKYMVDAFPGIGGEHDVIIPVVGECDDSWLNDIGGRHVHEEHVLEALRTASDGPVAEGSVGGGTGMITCDFKSGDQLTSSRQAPESARRLHPRRRLGDEEQFRARAQSPHLRSTGGGDVGRSLLGAAQAAGQLRFHHCRHSVPTLPCRVGFSSTVWQSGWPWGSGGVGSFAAHGVGGDHRLLLRRPTESRV